ncbi:MAG: hypothetical protein MR739_03215 [Spirochaetia bacterium]|nr:hypothetical protein [Spirochaetia bacterium]
MLRKKKREMHSIFSSRVCIANSRFSGLRYRFIPSLRFGTASPALTILATV